MLLEFDRGAPPSGKGPRGFEKYAGLDKMSGDAQLPFSPKGQEIQDVQKRQGITDSNVRVGRCGFGIRGLKDGA